MGLAIVGVLCSLVSVAYYLRLPVALFIDRPAVAARREDAERPAVVAPLAGATVLVCGLLVLVMGLIPGTVLNAFARRASAEMFVQAP